MQLRDALGRLLPLFAIVVFAGGVALTISIAGDTLGYDFRAYHHAARRVLASETAYDPNFAVAGPFGLFFYPPTFIPLVLPFGLMPEAVAIQAWIGAMVLAFVAALLAMPVGWRTRAWILLLAGVSWPFLYNVKLGQVGPLLVLCFALAWRWVDRPWLFGIAAAVGGAIKVQPGLLLAWALLRRRPQAVVAGIITLGALAALAYVFTGANAWAEFLALITRVSDPIATPQNTTPGAIAYQLGAPREIAAAVQLATTIVVGIAFVAAALVLPTEASLMVAIISTQLLSPILWDHYAIVLLVPVAWLLERGRLWAVVIPLATPMLAAGLLPAVIYPAVFMVTLAAVFLEAGRGRPRTMELPNWQPAKS